VDLFSFFFSPSEAAKNRIISPNKVLHFYHLAKEIDTPDKLFEIFFRNGSPIPAACEFSVLCDQRPTNSGHLVSVVVQDF
jgi:hypothetical protein